MTRGEHSPLRILASFFWALIMGSLLGAGLVSGLMLMHKIQSMFEVAK